MYNILLVDDEESIIHILQKIIEWQELGVSHIYTARDGLEAIEIMKKARIELLITDIRMPFIDGLHLIEKAKMMHKEMKCVLLTSYREFDYARKAITLGVENYLLKPVMKVELEQTVKKALDDLYQKRINIKDHLREHILRRWVRGEISLEELSDKAAILKLNMFLPLYFIICIRKTSVLDIAAFLEKMEEHLGRHGVLYSFWDEKGRFVIIIGAKKIQIPCVADELLVFMENEGMKTTVKASIGNPVSDVSLLHLSYQMACEHLDCTDNRELTVIFEEENQNVVYDDDFMMEEIRFLLYFDEENIQKIAYERFRTRVCLNVKEEESYKTLKKVMRVCTSVLLSEFPLKDMDMIKGMEEGIDFDAVYLSKNLFREIERVLFHTKMIYESFLEEFSPIVRKTCSYIWKNVLEGRGCSIKEFCVDNDMNTAYLGHIFKNNTGQYFNDYLERCRINRAIMLLYNPRNLVKDISEIVGYASASYFVRCFRERKGMSPEKYREEMIVKRRK